MRPQILSWHTSLSLTRSVHKDPFIPITSVISCNVTVKGCWTFLKDKPPHCNVIHRLLSARTLRCDSLVSLHSLYLLIALTNLTDESLIVEVTSSQEGDLFPCSPLSCLRPCTGPGKSTSLFFIKPQLHLLSYRCYSHGEGTVVGLRHGWESLNCVGFFSSAPTKYPPSRGTSDICRSTLKQQCKQCMHSKLDFGYEVFTA